MHILRAWLTTQDHGDPSWLRALRDSQIAAALARLHAYPDRPWTIESIAAEVAMSRAAFARRFTSLVGEAPLAYLARWRLNLAAQRLRDTDLPIAAVAAQVGYGSEYSFSRAFTRFHGQPPGRYRRQSRLPQSASDSGAPSWPPALPRAPGHAAPRRTPLAPMRCAGAGRHAGNDGQDPADGGRPQKKGVVMARANGSDARPEVAVIGAGIMGAAMTRNLVAAGLTTRVWDRSPSATGPLADAGAVVAGSAREAVRDAGVVITMLSTADAVESVIFDGGVADAFADGCVWAQMGTIGVEATRRIADRLAAQRPGVMFVDAPVSGSKGPAEQGQLLILASGPAAATDVVRPVFDVIGRKTVWLGEAGQGSLVKLVVNAYMSILIEGVAETMELADRLGIGHQQLAEVIEGGPLDAPIADAKLHKMDRQDYAAEFPLEWALKDVDLAISAAGGQAPPLLAALSGQWHAAVAAGYGRQDISAARLALAGPSRPS